MGRKEAQPPAAEEKEEAEEDTPLVKRLKELDDKYLALEKEFQAEVSKLTAEWAAKQKPLLEERAQTLATPDNNGANADKGTPALEGFWLAALSHHPAFEDKIEEWDAPVLEYLRDVTFTVLNPEKTNDGFKIDFHFVPNPYFTNEVLTKEFRTEEANPYRGEIEATEIKSTEIDWKEGKDVTIEKAAKKVKGGGAKKAKQKAKETVTARDSFFRHFFRSLTKDGTMPDELPPDEAELLEEDPEEALEYLMDNDLEVGNALKDSIIPFAVRWYTGECADDDDDDEDEEEEDEDDDDDDDDEDDDDEDDGRKPKGRGKNRGGGGGGGGKGGKGGGKDQGECKQQ